MAGIDVPEGVELRHRPLVDAATDDNPTIEPEDVARQQFEKNEYVQASQKMKLSWGERKDYRTPYNRKVPTDKKRGAFDGRLPGMKFLNHAWQNFRFILANGKECKLEDIPEEVTVHGRGKDQRGLVEKVRLRDLFRNYDEVMRTKAIEEDPLLCEFCFKFHADDVKGKILHVKRVHPANFEAWLEEGEPKQTRRRKEA